jgi:cob(I)alamin adenosyltransferase
MKIYTRTGDGGETGLFAGPRVWKDDPRIEAYGTVDELNAVLGFARSVGLAEDLDTLLMRLQNELFAAGAELATPDPASHGTSMLTDSHVTALEEAIDHYEQQLPELKQFIVPGGSQAAALMHLARTICRRAERALVTLQRQSEQLISANLMNYFNRLSDLLFVLGRVANQLDGHSETAWVPPATPTE